MRSGRAIVSEDEDDKPLLQPSSRTELIKENVNLQQTAVFLHSYEEGKDLQSGKTHLPHWNKMCQETRVGDQKESRYWAEIQTVKPFATSQ